MIIRSGDGHIFQSPNEYAPVVEYPEAIIRNILGRSGVINEGPQAFMAEQAPGAETGVHFHPIDQFQIMFGRPGGYFRRSPIPAAFVHYADAYSVYGPFGPGPDEAMTFFTLRGTATDLHGAMPARRSELLYRGERHYELDLERQLLERFPAGQVAVRSLLESHDDGLAIHLARVGPDTPFCPPGGELRTGRYTVVLNGEITVGDHTYGPLAVGWSKGSVGCSGGEIAEVSMRSGPDGAALLFLHLPYPTTPSTHAASASSTADRDPRHPTVA